MKKRKFYLMSLIMTIILCVSSVNVKAQVTIGSNEAPHPGAVLELKSSKGLLLSKVSLNDVNTFQLSGDSKTAKGMMVYNINSTISNGKGTGIYVWNGTKWQLVNLSGEAPVNLVTEVKIYTFPPVTSIVPNAAPLKLNAHVLPDSATNKNLIWSVVSGSASISADGNLTVNANATDKIVVGASATDESGKFDQYTLTLPPTGVITVPGGNNNNNYRVYCFDPSLKLGCWMIDNSKEGTPDATRYTVKPQGQSVIPADGERGYYYTWAHANEANGTAACPAGYSLPDNTLWGKLKDYIESYYASLEEKSYWFDATYLAGYKQYKEGWSYWNMTGSWWSSSSSADNNNGGYFHTSTTSFSSDFSIKTGANANFKSIRCVKSNY